MPPSLDRAKVIAAGVFSLILTVGIARFAYTPLLPTMIEDAGLSHFWGGWLATINYVGYLGGALLSMSIKDLAVKDRLYRLGLIMAIATTAAMGLTDNIWLWAILRFLSGLSSAAGMLLASGLVMHWLMRHGYRAELGVHFAGLGLGIALAAITVWGMEQMLPWDTQWLILAAIGLALLIPAWGWLPSPKHTAATAKTQPHSATQLSPFFMRMFLAAYFFAGIGYVITATFIVAIVEDLPGLKGQGPLAFLILGLAAAPAGALWDLSARRFGYVPTLILAMFLQVPAIIMPILIPGLVSVLLSTMLFGATFMGVVSLVLTMGGLLYPAQPAKLMGKMTLSYGAAQILAPALAAQLAAISGNYNASLYLPAASVALGGVLLVILQIKSPISLGHSTPDKDPVRTG